MGEFTLEINHNAMLGQPAVEITHFLCSKGADACLWQRAGGDDWLVIFNPKIIIAAVPRQSASIAVDEFDRPPVKVQIDTCAQWCANQAQKATDLLRAIATAMPAPR